MSRWRSSTSFQIRWFRLGHFEGHFAGEWLLLLRHNRVPGKYLASPTAACAPGMDLAGMLLRHGEGEYKIQRHIFVSRPSSPAKAPVLLRLPTAASAQWQYQDWQTTATLAESNSRCSHHLHAVNISQATFSARFWDEPPPQPPSPLKNHIDPQPYLYRYGPSYRHDAVYC
jgi:hypothetical protein